ncbi:MAG TPA: hypothetical protein VHC39_10115 [Rhizomicrobium sp.]|nr:hypothetical protein [Rhizomicrobium sp.]
MTLAEQISEMPEQYERGDESTAQLLLHTGYLDAPQALTVGDVEEALVRHPELVDRWLERGHDQLLAGGWGIECDHDAYQVKSYSSGRTLVEKKKLHAVAEFIVRYVRFIGDVLSRYRARGFRTSRSVMERQARIARNPNWWSGSPGCL